jgi:hypothetical protein
MTAFLRNNCNEKEFIKASTINEDCYLQTIGKAPKPISKELAGYDRQTHRKNEQRRELPSTGSKVVVLIME